MDRQTLTLPRPRTLTTGTPLAQVPTQRTRARADVPASPRTDRVPALAAVLSVLLVAGFGTSAGFALHVRASRAAAQARVASAAAAASADVTASQALVNRSASDAASTARSVQVEAAVAALSQAGAALDSSPHAGDVPRAQLAAASDALASVLNLPRTSPFQVASATAALGNPLGSVLDSEAQWQAADAARAAEQEAAAAARAAAQTRTGSQQGVRSSQVVVPVAPPAVMPTVPVGGKQCTDAGSGAQASSAAEIGDAINVYRQRNGLSALSVTQSATLSTHAVTMADAGGIWHSGADNIVGCVSNASASSLVVAWSRSAPHNAQMLRTDVTAMNVGGAVRDGWLYGAASFR